jgi:acyl carrier protein
MDEVFEETANIIVSICGVKRSDITPSVNLIQELGVDSLNFMDVTYEIDKRFKIKLPVDKWMVEINSRAATIADYFVMSNLVARVEKLIAECGTSSTPSQAAIEARI